MDLSSQLLKRGDGADERKHSTFRLIKGNGSDNNKSSSKESATKPAHYMKLNKEIIRYKIF